MKRDDKGLLDEILPDPTQAAEDLRRGSPRERTRSHLRKILSAAAAAGLAVGATVRADTTIPDKGQGDAKPPDGKPAETQPKPPERESLGYEVVDMMPEPYIEKLGGEGWLSVDSKPPGAKISIDGKELEQRTPLLKWKLPAGFHAVTLVAPDGTTENVTVKVKKGKTEKLKRDLRPRKAKKAPPPPAPKP